MNGNGYCASIIASNIAPVFHIKDFFISATPSYIIFITGNSICDSNIDSEIARGRGWDLKGGKVANRCNRQLHNSASRFIGDNYLRNSNLRICRISKKDRLSTASPFIVRIRTNRYTLIGKSTLGIGKLNLSNVEIRTYRECVAGIHSNRRARSIILRRILGSIRCKRQRNSCSFISCYFGTICIT